jgi:NarL family two-component system response regulator LiaR
MTKMTIRVMIVDDHVIVREGLRALLTKSEDMEIVGEASNGQEAIQQIESTKPDVVLMDLVMPEMDGIEAIKRITAENENIRILVITAYSGDDLVFPAIKAGAHGYLLKDSGSERLVEAIRQVYRGEPFLHPDIARKLMEEIRPSKPDRGTPDPLTARELEVLSLLARGLSNQEISEQLVIAEVTVRSHTSRLLDKLHLANRVQATLYALREGMVDLDENP